MLPPGWGIGFTASETFAGSASDTPLLSVSYGLNSLSGEFGGVSMGATLGTNPFTGGTEIMGIQVTVGFGATVPLSPITVTLPTVQVTSPTP